MTATRPRRSGLILLLTLLVMGLLVFLGSVFLDFYRGSQDVLLRLTSRIAADGAAMGGLRDAHRLLKTDAAWTAGFTQEPLPNGATYTVTFDPAAGLPYSTNNGAGTVAVTGYRGRRVPPGMIHIISLGTYGRATMQSEELISVRSGTANVVFRW